MYLPVDYQTVKFMQNERIEAAQTHRFANKAKAAAKTGRVPRGLSRFRRPVDARAEAARTTPAITKDSALKYLGVLSKSARRKVGGHLDFVQCSAGRKLLAAGQLSETVMIVVDGSVRITDRHGNSTNLRAPIVVDSWAVDDRGVATLDVTATTAVSMIVFERNAQAVIAGYIPRHVRLSKSTRDAVTADADVVISLTEDSELAPTEASV